MSSATEGFGGALDLSGADTKGFEALDSATYDCELFDFTWAETKGPRAENPDAKMPAGTPMLKLQLKVIEEPYENRRLFDQFVIPPDDYDSEKRAKMLGALVRFFVAMGMDEAKVKDKKFKLNEALENLVGEPVRVTVSKKQKYGTKPEDNEWDNEVKGYKPIGSADGPAPGKLL